MKRILSFAIVVICVLLIFSGCRKQAVDTDNWVDLLVSIDGHKLSKSDVAKVMPANLSPADSARFVNTYVKNWIGKTLLFEKAKKNVPDMEQIDELVEQYRRQLIIFEYQKQLVHEKLESEISENDLKAYYDSHMQDFKLKKSLIKGLFLKVPEGAPQLDQIRRWYKKKDSESIEQIEKYSLRNAVGYEYFYDKWVSFHDIMDNIPYTINNEDTFLKDNKTLEVQDNGFWYFLNISEYLPAGADEPFDFAKTQIHKILINERKLDFIRSIENELYQKARDNSEIVFFQWNKDSADEEPADSVALDK